MRKLRFEEAICLAIFNISYFIPFAAIHYATLYLGYPDNRVVGLIELFICMSLALAIKLAIERYWPAWAFWKDA